VLIETRRHIASETRKRIFSQKEEGNKDRERGEGRGIVYTAAQSKEHDEKDE
jgi:hypothetical protein